MKIVHISESYIEGWGYQENLLPLYQKLAGHEVVVVSNNNHLVDIKNRPELIAQIMDKGNEYWCDGIKIYKIKTFLNISSNASFICYGLYKILEKEKPDMIFHHNLNTSSLTVAARYKDKHPKVKLYVDNHADWINESKNRLWHALFYDIIIPLQVKCLGNRVDNYIGVSPLRCKYLKEVFKVPEKKIRFLPIGCDTIGTQQVTKNREQLRKQYHIQDDSFVVVSGGKLDRSKGTLVLIEACNSLKEKISNLRLVLFGKIDEEVMKAAQFHDWITMEGWCDRKKTLSLLKMADVACWPWLHTTLIEDAVATGTPLVVKMSDNVSHFAKEHAGIFLKCGDYQELINAILDINANSSKYRESILNARQKFSYTTLVKLLEEETFCQF